MLNFTEHHFCLVSNINVKIEQILLLYLLYYDYTDYYMSLILFLYPSAYNAESVVGKKSIIPFVKLMLMLTQSMIHCSDLGGDQDYELIFMRNLNL